MKGYISQYGRTTSISNYDNDIVFVLHHNFLKQCFELIGEGYDEYLLDSEKVFSADETIITAGICGHIDTIIKKQALPFDIITEYCIHSENIKRGKLSPKKAKRFDLRILSWDKNNKKLTFGVEAKLLVETNYNSKKIKNLINEYVENAGMGKFINKIYDESAYNYGLMLGYVLNGKTNNIVEEINIKISAIYSTREHLTENENHYVSSYSDDGTPKKLYHIFLNFSALII